MAGLAAGPPEPPRLTTPHQALWSGVGMLAIVAIMFMAFYGLVFPTYVWLFMVPSLRRRRPVAARPPRPATVIFYVAVLILAAPGYWMGFIEGRMRWLIPGMALVLLSRALLPKGPPAEAEPETASAV